MTNPIPGADATNKTVADSVQAYKAWLATLADSTFIDPYYAFVAGSRSASAASADRNSVLSGGWQYMRGVEAAYPIPNNPNTSVVQRAVDNRAAFQRGFDTALAAVDAAPKPVDAAQAVPVIPHSMSGAAAARKQHERINAMQQGVVGVLAAIKQEAEAVKRGAIIGSPSAPADAAFHYFWYSYMKNEQMQPPLHAISYSTAKFIWDSAAPSPVEPTVTTKGA